MPTPLTDEITVNTTLNGAQDNSFVARLPGGGWVVIWNQSIGGRADPLLSEVKAQVFAADGSRFGGEFTVNATSAGNQSAAGVTGTETGFVVLFRDASPSNAESEVVRIRGFDLAGVPSGPADVLVDESEPGVRIARDIAGLGGSAFIVALEDFSRRGPLGSDPNANDVLLRVYADTATPTTGEIDASVPRPGQQQAAQLARLADGRFVVVSEDDFAFEANNNERENPIYRIYSATGVPEGLAREANTIRLGVQDAPDVAGLTSGGFVVVWRTGSVTSSQIALRGQIFDPTGAKLGGEFPIGPPPADGRFPSGPQVRGLPDGGFVVVWRAQDNGVQSIRLQQLDAMGSPVGAEVEVDAAQLGRQGLPQVEVLADGRILVTWDDGTSADQDVKSRLYAPTPAGAGPTGGDDELVGTSTRDLIDGLAGNDDISGRAGDDELTGGAGDDVVLGNGGDDVLLGGVGDDELNGNTGDDEIDGGEGDDGLLGKDGDDVVRGGGGNDRMSGGEGGDDMDGGSGDDGVFGENGDDDLTGGAGQDRVYGGEGNDMVDGGADNDLLGGDAGDDTVRGGAGKDRLDGGEGNDDLFGDGGNDTLRGGAGEDALDGGAGRDRLLGGAGADRLTGGGDKDVFDLTGNLGATDLATDFDGAAGDRFALGGGLFTTLTLTDADGDGDLDTRLEHADGVVIVLGVDDASLATFNGWVI